MMKRRYIIYRKFCMMKDDTDDFNDKEERKKNRKN